jgi:RHS repeat-associated protein
VTRGTAAVTIAYDNADRRTSLTLPNGIVVEYALSIDEYFTRTDASGVGNFLTDALMSTVALADGSGTVQTAYTYEPFGGTTATGASTSSAFAFTGREADPTGLYYYRARYYEGRLHRFVSEDPLGLEGGDSNLFAYVRNTPANATDPLGLEIFLFGSNHHITRLPPNARYIAPPARQIPRVTPTQTPRQVPWEPNPAELLRPTKPLPWWESWLRKITDLPDLPFNPFDPFGLVTPVGRKPPPCSKVPPINSVYDMTEVVPCVI